MFEYEFERQIVIYDREGAFMRKKIIFWVFVFIMAVSLAYAVIYNVRLDEIARRTFDGRYTVVYALMALPCLHFTVSALIMTFIIKYMFKAVSAWMCNAFIGISCICIAVYAMAYILACEFLWLDMYALIRDEYDIFVLAGAFMAIGVFCERE